MSSQDIAGVKDEPVILPKKNQNILKMNSRDQPQLLNGVSSKKAVRNLEKNMSMAKSAKVAPKDTPSFKLKKRNQKSINKSSKNRRVLHKSSESGDLHGTKKPNLLHLYDKVSEISQDVGRKSLRLLKKENNLEECKG